MPVAPLTEQQVATVAEAARLLDAGRPRDAAEAVAEMIAGGCQHPDPLMVYSLACEQLGMMDDAAGACRAALRASPERADLWGSLGRLAHQAGHHAEAIELLDRAVAMNQTAAEHWYNLGLARGAAGDVPSAISAMSKASELRPGWAQAWGGLGHFQEVCGALDEAETSLRKALELDPALEPARYSLAMTLRRLGDSQEAIAVAEIGATAATRLVAAQVLADTGHSEAPDRLRSLLVESPDLAAGHDSFARLMPQLGRPTESLETYRAALKVRPTHELYSAALIAARDLGEAGAMLEWTQEARRLFGDHTDFTIFEALAAARQGHPTRALEMLEPIAAAGRSDVLNHCAYLRLSAGDFDAAEAHALAATRADFTDQLAWAALTVIWRLKSDPKEQWLADYERFVMAMMVEPPSGFDTIDAFMGALAEELHALHNTDEHPTDQSLRNGTQTRGLLFDRRSPLLRSLAGIIRTQAGERLAKLPMDAGHPFLARNNGKPVFKGSWSVRLRSGGFHVGHVHNQGWLSSALYVELPAEMGSGRGSGALQFGVPNSQFGIDLPPRRTVQPKVGQLVIFPSYFWHGTLPFKSQAHRLSIAFDMVPG